MSLPAFNSSVGVYRRLLGMVGKHRIVFALALLAVAFDAAGQGLFFYLLRPLIDDTIAAPNPDFNYVRSEEHTSELQSRGQLVCRPLLEKKKKSRNNDPNPAF